MESNLFAFNCYCLHGFSFLMIRGPDGRKYVRWSGDPQIDADITAVLAIFEGRKMFSIFAMIPELLVLIFRSLDGTESEVSQTMDAIKGEVLRLVSGRQ